MSDAVPFELLESGGYRIATNGTRTVMLRAPAGEGRLFRRRGMRGVAMGSPGAALLPELNRLAGDLVARLDMPADELAQRIAQLTAIASPRPPVPVEWAVAELGGVRVYVDGESVIVTRDDLTP